MTAHILQAGNVATGFLPNRESALQRMKFKGNKNENRHLRIDVFPRRQTANYEKARDLVLAVVFGANSRRLQLQGGSFPVSDLLQDFIE